MTVLAVDIGNTHTVFGCFDPKGNLLNSYRVQTDRDSTAHEILVLVERLLGRDGFPIESLQRVILGSVVPELNNEWQRAFASVSSSLRFEIINHKSAWSFSVGLPDPAQAGADRLADVEAALKHHKAPLIIVDAGTATTFDVVDTDANGKAIYAGGVICPGVGISLNSLVARTSRLKSIQLTGASNEHPAVVGTSTESALRSGVIHGFASMVEGLVHRICEERQWKRSAVTVLATGGFGELLRHHSKIVNEFRPELTLEGFYEVTKRH